METLTDEELRCAELYKIYNDSESKIKSEALVNFAFINKVSEEIIQNKVNAQMEAIKVEIYSINPKFKEGSKNYEETKKLVTEALSNYEQALIELSKFYDSKLEQLILKKVELEAVFINSILTEEYLDHKIFRKNNQKENDIVKRTVADNIKSVFEKFRTRKEKQSELDPKMITNMLDQQDLANELDYKLSNRVEKSKKEKTENKELMDNTQREISLIEEEISKINERKRKFILDAMEVGSKELVVNIRKPKIFKRITRFFVSRFNTAKVVENVVINPLNLRIEEFRTNELSSMKG